MIDFHTHVFPASFREKRDELAAKDPGFASLYSDPRARMVGVDHLLEHMEKEGIERSVVFGFPWVLPELYRQHNDYVADAVARYPKRLVGFCCFYPLSPGGGMEAERCLKNGLSGIGELAIYGKGLSRQAAKGMRDAMEVALAHDVPVMLHTNEPLGHEYPGKSPMSVKQIYNFVKTYPSNKIILAHWGGGLFFYALLKKEVREALASVWFDTAASPFLYDSKIYRVAGEIIGFNKILFGTDYPLIPAWRYKREFDTSGLNKRQLEMITDKNARELLGLKEKEG